MTTPSPPAMHDAPYSAYAAVTTSDTVDISCAARSFYIGVSGDVALVGYDNAPVVFKAVPVGILRVAGRRINATGTTATNILALV